MAEITRWAREVQAVGERIGPHFARSEPRQRAVHYIRALLSDTPRKNGWQLAEHLGEATPDGVQHLLARANWDADAVRDESLPYVAEHMGESDGVLIVDETSFLKKGTKSCGVARQYSGTAGRIENCQIGVFLAYATSKGHTLLDRALYLPKEWTTDATHCKAAGIPKEVTFATKIVLAKQMIECAVANGLPARWVMADTVDGSDDAFRKRLEQVGLNDVVGVRSHFTVCRGFHQHRVGQLLHEIPSEAWQRLSCGTGTKGPRWYEWACCRVNSPEPETDARWLLLLELGKGECGLDEYEVRSWAGWYRHVTLSLWALAMVVTLRARLPRPKTRK